ncbi:PREDICTED: uncharacterized protein LOC108370010 [Rhagoletis zephyria]|uniref:uncharacterized protein LOC108370010 n=1 Tax=Rhagoletis zephyria TaxID=28612 RepID=UPI0008117790|nr:PREDICTED: uncharacterized protein LOC108370010 [Rhagoletis zephyria]
MDGHNVESNDDSFLKSRKSKDKPPLWDTFQDPPSRRATGSAASWAKLGCFLKIFKFLTYIFVFIVVLATATTSKISFLLMVSRLRKNAVVKRCNALAVFRLDLAGCDSKQP